MPNYQVLVTVHSTIDYINLDKSTGSASSVSTVTASSSDIHEKKNIESSLISNLEEKLVNEYLLSLIPKDNLASYSFSHDYKTECKRI